VFASEAQPDLPQIPKNARLAKNGKASSLAAVVQ
jgi:hypothetical protein